MKKPAANNSAAGIHVHGVEYSAKLFQGHVRAPIPIHMRIHAGTRTRKGDASLARHRCARGCTISQNAGMVE